MERVEIQKPGSPVVVTVAADRVVRYEARGWRRVDDAPKSRRKRKTDDGGA